MAQELAAWETLPASTCTPTQHTWVRLPPAARHWLSTTVTAHCLAVRSSSWGFGVHVLYCLHGRCRTLNTFCIAGDSHTHSSQMPLSQALVPEVNEHSDCPQDPGCGWQQQQHGCLETKAWHHSGGNCGPYISSSLSPSLHTQRHWGGRWGQHICHLCWAPFCDDCHLRLLT